MKKAWDLTTLFGITVLLVACSGANPSSSVPPSSSSSETSTATSSDVPSSSGSTASSSYDPVKRNVKTKNLDVYTRNKVTDHIDAYFLDDLDAPYFSLADIVSKRAVSVEDNGFPVPDYTISYDQGVMEASQTYNGATYSIFFDSVNDLVYSDHYLDAIDIYHNPLPVDFTGADPSPIIKPVSVSRVSPAKRTTFDLRAYDIDLYDHDGVVLIPLVVLNPVFFTIGEKSYAYNGKAVFNSVTIGLMGSGNTSFYTYSEDEKNIDRNQSTTDFCANSLFWTLNTFYGRNDEVPWDSFESFAKSIGVYEELHSPSPATYFAGLGKLISGIDDGHSMIQATSPLLGDPWAKDDGDKWDKEAKALIFKVYNDWLGHRAIDSSAALADVNAQRNEHPEICAPGAYEFKDDTCFIRFDSFQRQENSSVFGENHEVKSDSKGSNTYSLVYYAFKDIKANHPEIKNIVFDESANTGGDATTLIEMAGFLMKTVSITVKNSITGEIFDYEYQVDTNYDGVYDDNDFQADGYNVYCQTSAASFSCANLFPSILRTSGAAKMIGESTCGGCCAVVFASSALGDPFRISSPIRFGYSTGDGGFVSNDRGVVPDIAVDRYDMFNEARIINLINSQGL